MNLEKNHHPNLPKANYRVIHSSNTLQSQKKRKDGFPYNFYYVKIRGMTKFVTKFVFLAAILILFSFSAHAAIPKVQEITSAKGIKFWAIEDNYLPIVSLKIAFTKSGAAYDPEQKQGLANMVAGLLVEGAGGLSGIEYMKQIEGLASNISFSADSDSFYVSLTCLKENLDESLRLLALAIESPDFSKDAVERVRKSTISNIEKQDESPETRARKAFQENYFAGHPYSRQIDGTVAGVKSIEKKDLQTFVKEKFSRQNMLVGVTGSATSAEMSALLDKYFANLPVAGNLREIPEFVPGSNLGKIIKIHQDVPQSIVIFGVPGPKRLDADFYPTYLLNYILGGGGFESRLMQEVREKRGLAYTVYTGVHTYRHAGLISGYVATKNESIDESLKIIRAEIEKIYQTGITKQELADTGDYLVGSFPLRMTQNASLASFITSMQEDNLGVNFLEKRNSYIRGVNIEVANAAAVKYLDPTKMLVVVVGKNK